VKSRKPLNAMAFGFFCLWGAPDVSAQVDKKIPARYNLSVYNVQANGPGPMNL
jgi:hypothetical protein